MRRLFSLISVCLLLSAAAEPLCAQQRLFALTYKEIIEFDTRPSMLGRPLGSLPLPHPTLFGVPALVPVAGGTFLSWASAGSLALVETRTGSLRQYSLPGLAVSDVLGTSADSFTLVMLGAMSGRNIVLVGDLRQGSVRLMDIGPLTSSPAVAYAAQADLLFVARARNTANVDPRDFFDVDVFTLGNSTLVKTIPIQPVDARQLAVNGDGTRLFVTSFYGGVSAFDVASGDLLATHDDYSSLWAVPAVDERRQRVVKAHGGSAAILEMLSVDTLQLVDHGDLPPTGNPAGLSVSLAVDVSAQSDTIFALQAALRHTDSRSPPVCEQSMLTALNADTGGLRESVDLFATVATRTCGPYLRLARLTEPGAPANFVASVTGHSVSLDWGAAAALRYELEAGSAPGLTNLATLDVTETHLTVDGVPPGVYYLRVRAVNTIGKSAPSQEIPVVVQ